MCRLENTGNVTPASNARDRCSPCCSCRRFLWGSRRSRYGEANSSLSCERTGTEEVGRAGGARAKTACAPPCVASRSGRRRARPARQGGHATLPLSARSSSGNSGNSAGSRCTAHRAGRHQRASRPRTPGARPLPLRRVPRRRAAGREARRARAARSEPRRLRESRGGGAGSSARKERRGRRAQAQPRLGSGGFTAPSRRISRSRKRRRMRGTGAEAVGGTSRSLPRSYPSCSCSS